MASTNPLVETKMRSGNLRQRLFRFPRSSSSPSGNNLVCQWEALRLQVLDRRPFHDSLSPLSVGEGSSASQNVDSKISSESYAQHLVHGEVSNVDEDQAEEDFQPWKYLLEMPARAAWRVSDPHPPKEVVDAQKFVISASMRTKKQSSRTFEEVIAVHKALADKRERERRRLVNDTRYSFKERQKDQQILPVFYGRGETIAALTYRMQPNYAIVKRVLEEAQSLLGTNNNNDGSPASWTPRRIVDFGSGCGSASAAALEVFDEIEWLHGIDPSQCMRECSGALLNKILENTETERKVVPRVTFSASLSAESASSSFDMALFAYTATELPDYSSTLVAAAILWEKLAPNGIFVMIEPGTPDGFNSIRSVRNMLLDCSPPYPSNIDEDDENDEFEDDVVMDQCHVIAPCTHSGKCPMERHQHDFFKQPFTQKDDNSTRMDDDLDFDDDDLDSDDHEEFSEIEWDDHDDESEDDESEEAHTAHSALIEETELLNTRFCSFVQTFSSSKSRKGEKFSYFVAQKRIQGMPAVDEENNFGDAGLTDLLSEFYDLGEETKGQVDYDDVNEATRHRARILIEKAKNLERRFLDSDSDELGLELVSGDQNRSSFGRIVRAPLKRRGHVYIDYCTGPGKIMRSRVTKSMSEQVAPGIYTAARKSRWGGLWPSIAQNGEEDKKS